MARRMFVIVAALAMGSSLALSTAAGASPSSSRAGDTPIIPAALACASQIAVSGGGGVHITDPCTEAVYKVANHTLIAGRDHSGCPVGIAYDSSDDEFVTDRCSGRLSEFAAGASTATILVRHLVQGGSDSIVIKWGRIILANEFAHSVIAFNMDGTDETTWLAAGVNGVPDGFNPTGITSVGHKIAVNDANDAAIYLCDEGCATVKSISGVGPSNQAQTLATGVGGSLLEAAGSKVWQRHGGTWIRFLRVPGTFVVNTIATTSTDLFFEESTCGRAKVIETNLDGSNAKVLYSSAAVIPVDRPTGPNGCAPTVMTAGCIC